MLPSVATRGLRRAAGRRVGGGPDGRAAATAEPARTRRSAARAAGVAAGVVGLLLAVGACAAADDGPVPDDALFDQIDALPGVVSSDIHYMHGLWAPDVYGGGIDVAPGVDAVCVLDQVYEILWQGRHVDIAVNAFQPGMQTVERRNFLGSDKLVQRYGPRPTASSPTPSVPACRPPAPDAPTTTPLPDWTLTATPAPSPTGS
jgi:hypothetical protein